MTCDGCGYQIYWESDYGTYCADALSWVGELPRKIECITGGKHY